MTENSVAVGWGRKTSGLRAERAARREGAPLRLLEDGFIRSYGLGASGAPSLSWVVDELGIYYDATCPSSLETWLNAGDFTAESIVEAGRVLDLIRRDGLSKYNLGRSLWQEGEKHASCAASENPGPNKPALCRVLVVDQTAGDASIRYGMASMMHFASMLEAAMHENPQAEIWVKTHPDVLLGKKRGCLDAQRKLAGAERVRWIGADVHPHALLRAVDHVYVVTSQMGFDALLLGKTVTCFGMPFYAGWGLTDDRQACGRRTRACTLPELAAAAFLRYTRYVKPESGEAGTFFDVAAFIARQKRMTFFWEQTPSMEMGRNSPDWSGRVFCFGFRYWKHAHVRPFFGEGVALLFVRSADDARGKGIKAGDRIAVWGQKDNAEVAKLAREIGVSPVRVEDGFLRSVGLGADFVPPLSLVFDRRGIYFDPSEESDLEYLLNTTDFSEELLARARHVIRWICEERLTKYNIERDAPLQLETQGRRVVLVPGQVEDDASVLKGAGRVNSNAELLRTVRAACPDAFILYKPHPDVLARNRRGQVDWERIRAWCDHVESGASVIRCIEFCDEVHTMTSLTGFDALLRGKQVVTYGRPFYAGWGLTQDRESMSRRARALSLDALVAGALLLYPRYFDPGTGGFVECETVIERLVQQRANRPSVRGLRGVRRQLRKWSAFCRGLWDAWSLR
ncbi:MAG: capsular polysaccharide biosynthesis protein [Pseudomonadota bacterium]